MKMTYAEFENQMRGNGYSGREISHIFRAFMEMDNESRSWLLGWLIANRIPEKEIEGVSARYLIDELKYAPVNAFIILDWLKTDPQAAKYFVMKSAVDANIGETAAREIEKIMQRDGVKPSAQPDEPKEGEELEAE